MHPRLAEELLRVRAERAEETCCPVPGDERIFLGRSGRPWVTTQRAFSKAARRAGLEGKQGLCFHSLRHTFAVHFLEGGAAVTDLQGLLGHADLATTQIYARMMDSRTRESLLALDYWVGPGTRNGGREAAVPVARLPVPRGPRVTTAATVVAT